MRSRAREIAIGVVVFVVCVVGAASAQKPENVNYFPDQIAEKEDHVVRLSGGSSWLLANRTLALVAADVVVVTRDVVVEGKRVRAAWLYVAGEEIPAQHVEGVYPANPAFLTRVIASEDKGTKLRLEDGTELLVPGYNSYNINRWVPPYKVLLTGNRLSLYNLKDGRRVQVQPAKGK